METERFLYMLDKERILDKGRILGSVSYRMENRQKHAAILDKMPHKTVLDLVAGYHCNFVLGGYQMGLQLTHNVCRHYGISGKELEEAATRNTKGKGIYVYAVEEIMAEMLGIPDAMPDPAEMLVLTNLQMRYGASVLLYPEALQEAADRIGGDMYILPASVHEVLAVPVQGVTNEAASLLELVKDANRNPFVINKDEVLSDSVYRYSRDGGLSQALPEERK